MSGRRPASVAPGAARGLALLVGLLFAASSAGVPARSQYSPHCLLNGRRRFCALTPGGAAPPGWSGDTVVLDDHQAYRLERQDNACVDQGTARRCPARIIPANGQGTPIPATYAGEAYEGGYRHRYSSQASPPLSLTLFFLD
ncbi:MAG: hypothetical protein VKP70_00730 [Cyanobacteriota bacterium]|nr:hypothetical protein [Cyanobacteriota bacterium]